MYGSTPADLEAESEAFTNLFATPFCKQMPTKALCTITGYQETAECDLCSKDAPVVIATFRTAFPPDSHLCFLCLKKLVLVDHKHSMRAAKNDPIRKQEAKNDDTSGD